MGVYTLAGTHLATFQIDSMSESPSTHIAVRPDTARAVLAERPGGAQRARRVPLRASRSEKGLASSFSRRSSTASGSASGLGSASRIAGGGLGVRQVAWHPSSAFLAIGGYDGHVRILASEDWSEVYTLDVRRTTLAKHTSTAVVWHEPRRWFEATEGQGIVALEQSRLPTEAPFLRADDPLKHGVCWLEWNYDGSVLAVRNETLPTTVFVYTFEGLSERRVDAHLVLSAVLVLASPIHALAWKPGQQSTLALVTGRSSVYLYSLQSSGEQSAEAVAIPNGALNFAAYLSRSISCTSSGLVARRSGAVTGGQRVVLLCGGCPLQPHIDRMFAA